MSQGYSGYPRVTAGKNIVVEELLNGFRVSARPDPFDTYRGFFQVRPFPNYSAAGTVRRIQVVNGALPYEESLTAAAGYVSIDRLHQIAEEKGGGIGCRRMRFPVETARSLSVPIGRNFVFLKITAHSGGSAGRLKFKEQKNRTVFFSHDYLLLPDVPELKEGVIYFPLAELDCDDAGRFSVIQLCSGEPSGVIMNYYGSDTLDDSDSGESSSSSDGESSSSGEESSSSSSSSSSDGESSSSGEESSSSSSSSDGESSSSGEESSSSDGSSSSSGKDESSSSEDEESSDGESSSTDPGSGSGSGSDSGEPSGSGGGSDSGGDGTYDPDLWYIVANCIRYICHPSLGLENFSGTTDYFAAKGDKIKFDPEPAPPTEMSPIAEWYGVAMIEGPYQDRLDIPPERLTELNDNHVGESC